MIDFLMAPIPFDVAFFGVVTTSLMEIIASVLTLVCVIGASFRKIWSYPVGIIATIMFFFIFFDAKLYSSATLQVFFTAVQIYGWWYWTAGDAGQKPLITVWTINDHIALVFWSVFAVICATILMGSVGALTAGWDAGIFAFSVAAQILLDRKVLTTWLFWIMVNIVSIFVYGGQGLFVTTVLYMALLGNAIFGFWEWAKAYGDDHQGDWI